MTATADKTATDKLPEFEGDQPAYSVVKFSGTGTGFSDGQRVAPVAMHKGETAYFVLRATVAGIDHHDDKDGNTFRRHDLKIDEMAPLSQELADDALATYAAEIQKIREEMDGQSALDFENAAAAREAADGTATPADIAADAAARVKGE